MKVVAVFFSILGVLALLAMPDTGTQSASAEAVAVNFVQYRTVANNAALAAPPASGGRIEAAAMDMGTGWQTIRAWSNRMDGNRFYVFGPVSGEEFMEIRRILRGSLAITRQDGTHPSFIPIGDVVSVIEAGS